VLLLKLAGEVIEFIFAPRHQDQIVAMRRGNARKLETDAARCSGDESGHFR
jgi:hypothetical protein